MGEGEPLRGLGRNITRPGWGRHSGKCQTALPAASDLLCKREFSLCKMNLRKQRGGPGLVGTQETQKGTRAPSPHGFHRLLLILVDGEGRKEGRKGEANTDDF